jgi:hypothetical protein
MTTPLRTAPAIVFCFALIFGGPALGQASKSKERPERTIEADKLFPYYGLYLDLPPQGRDGFAMRYRLIAREGLGRPQLFFVLGAARTPIEVSPTGRILTMPDLNMYRNGKVFIPAGQPAASINLDIDALVPLSRAISIADAVNPINDYAAATRRAGPLALLAPKLNSVRFTGGSGGEAILANGRRIPLPTAPEGGVLFTPSAAAMRGATSLAFTTAPTSVNFANSGR